MVAKDTITQDLDETNVDTADNTLKSFSNDVDTSECSTEINCIDSNKTSQKYCPQCGNPVDKEKFCPNCGSALTENPKSTNSNKRFKTKALVVVGVIIITLIIALIAYLVATNIFIPKSHYDSGISLMASGDYDNAITEFAEAGNYKDSIRKIDEAKELKEQQAKEKALRERLAKFKLAYSKCSSSGTSLSSDGKSIIVDSQDQYDYKSLADILIIINELALPSSLAKEMSSTNSLMGRLSETYGDIQVSWSYHPDNGLDVVFRLVD